MLLFFRAASLLYLAVVATTASAQELRVATAQSQTMTAAIDHMADIVRDGSEGRLSLSISHGGQLGSERFLIEKVRAGALDLTSVDLDAFGSIAPTASLLSKRFLYASGAAFLDALEGPLSDRILADLERAGFVGLALYRGGWTSFFSARRPIRDVADLRGLKIRVGQQDAWSRTLARLGARTVAVPSNRLQVSFKADMIDTAEGDLVGYQAARYEEVAPHFSPTRHAYALGIVVISKKSWDRLPAERQELLRRAALQSAQALARSVQSDAPSRCTTTTPSVASDNRQDAFRRALRDIYVSELKDPQMQRLIPE